MGSKVLAPKVASASRQFGRRTCCVVKI